MKKVIIIVVFGVSLLGALSLINRNQGTSNDPCLVRKVHNLIILDASGSMEGLKKMSVDGVNGTIQTIREAMSANPEREQFLTLVTFSGKEGVKYQWRAKHIVKVKDLVQSQFNPRGMTPLLDAIGKVCTRLERQIDDDTQVLVTIITDGRENASTNFTQEEIRILIKRLDKDGWVFTYIGANQDAFDEANELGIRNALQYESDKEGTRLMWEKERRSRQSFYSRMQTIKSRTQLQDGYFE